MQWLESMPKEPLAGTILITLLAFLLIVSGITSFVQGRKIAKKDDEIARLQKRLNDLTIEKRNLKAAFNIAAAR